MVEALAPASEVAKEIEQGDISNGEGGMVLIRPKEEGDPLGRRKEVSNEVSWPS